MKGNFETAIKIGRPVAREALQTNKHFVASECPLAGMHIVQGMELQAKDGQAPALSHHPIELFARAYDIAATGA